MNNKVLIIGSGGREHAMARALSEARNVSNVFVLPGNGGTATMAGKVKNIRHIKSDDYTAIAEYAVQSDIDLVCIGPEKPLVDGLCDLMVSKGVTCVGPSQAASVIESSKSWSKCFMKRHGIPTAKFSSFDSVDLAIAYVNSVEHDIVIKVSGLAAGKGVIIPNSKEEAIQAVVDIMCNNKFGVAGKEIIIEEKLRGEEVSILAFCDGNSAVPMPAAQDHKRALDDDKGPNTGGMGAYAPARVFEMASLSTKRACIDIIQRTVTGLCAEGIPYRGVLYTGFMLTDDGPKVLEYNCRFGDPEAQVLLPLLESNLCDILTACTKGKLCSEMVKWRKSYASAVVLCSSGYPGTYSKGEVIPSCDSVRDNSAIVFYAGAEEVECETAEGSRHACMVTTGGRVLASIGIGRTLQDAVNKSYRVANKLLFPGACFRTDIAKRSLTAPLRIGVLGSTRGTDLEAIVSAINEGDINATIAVCISNKLNSGILDRARRHGITAVHIGARNKSRDEYDRLVGDELEENGVELIILIGYMRILSEGFVDRWQWRCLNVHPSLLPDFAGGMDLDVHAAVLASGKTITGCTVHFVTQDVDEGPIVLQRQCSVNPAEDSVADLKNRVQKLEGEALVESIHLFIDGHIGPSVNGVLRSEEVPITYKSSGVDIDAGESLVQKIKPMTTRRPGCSPELGGFGGLFDLNRAGLSGSSDTVLVSGADGVGTKLLVAQAVGKHDTVGVDLVAMNVNDILVCGAEPLYFMDYFSCGQLDVDVAAEVVSGISNGCRQAGAALIGGETAEMSGMYRKDEYDLAGFCVGAVSRSKLLPLVSEMVPGDVLLGLRSSGVHSNGYSLVRKCVEKSGLSWTDKAPFAPDSTLGEALLVPTKIYVPIVLPLIRQGLLKGMAHITGGGLVENLPRVLPAHLSAFVDVQNSNWHLPSVFAWIQSIASISDTEMLRTFNCGVGMVLVVSSLNLNSVCDALREVGEEPLSIGVLDLRPHVEFTQVHISGKF